MISKTDICNLALIEAKYDETIENMEERSVSAERCKRLYDICRREILVGYPWVFATRFVSLPRLSGNVDGFKYLYEYPSYALRISAMYQSADDYKNKNNHLELGSQARVVYFEGKKCIASNFETLFAETITDEKVEENFPSLFVRMLYLDMAMRLSKLAGEDNGYLQLLSAQFADAENRARMQSVGEDDNNVGLISDNYYIDVRG